MTMNRTNLFIFRAQNLSNDPSTSASLFGEVRLSLCLNVWLSPISTSFYLRIGRRTGGDMGRLSTTWACNVIDNVTVFGTELPEARDAT